MYGQIVIVNYNKHYKYLKGTFYISTLLIFYILLIIIIIIHIKIINCYVIVL